MMETNRIYNYLENTQVYKCPEVSLWLAVLERLLIDFNEALAKKRFREVEIMIRQMENDHIVWICEACGIHPDRITNYFYDRMTNRKKNTLDLRFKKTYR